MGAYDRKKSQEKTILYKFLSSNFGEFKISQKDRESPDFEVDILDEIYGVEILRFFDSDIAKTETKMIKILEEVLYFYNSDRRILNKECFVQIKAKFKNNFEKIYSIEEKEILVKQFVEFLYVYKSNYNKNYTLKNILSKKNWKKKFAVLKKYFKNIYVKHSYEIDDNNIIASYKYGLSAKSDIIKNKINQKIKKSEKYDKDFYENWLVLVINYNNIKIKNPKIKLISQTGSNALSLIKKKITELDIDIDKNIFDKIYIFDFRDGKYIELLKDLKDKNNTI